MCQLWNMTLSNEQKLKSNNELFIHIHMKEWHSKECKKRQCHKCLENWNEICRENFIWNHITAFNPACACFFHFFFVFWIGSYVSLTKLNTTGVQWHIYRIKFGVDARCTIMSTLIKLIVEIHMKFFDISHMKWWIDNNGWCLSCYINTMAVFGVLRQNVCQTCESTDCKNQQRKNCGCWSRNKPK